MKRPNRLHSLVTDPSPLPHGALASAEPPGGARDATPVPMLLWCPSCGERHVDQGRFASKPHHTHACQSCGMVWRPALVPTVGVRFLPGFKDTDVDLGSHHDQGGSPDMGGEG